jgi:hypothetical protein
MKLFPIPQAAVQYVTCSCGRVLHCVDGVAVCEPCELEHEATVKTRPLEGSKRRGEKHSREPVARQTPPKYPGSSD